MKAIAKELKIKYNNFSEIVSFGAKFIRLNMGAISFRKQDQILSYFNVVDIWPFLFWLKTKRRSKMKILKLTPRIGR